MTVPPNIAEIAPWLPIHKPAATKAIPRVTRNCSRNTARKGLFAKVCDSFQWPS